MISVLIPTVATGRLPILFETVKSIQAGTYKDVQIIIISDGNLKSYSEAKKHLKNVTVLMNEKRIGWPTTINKMLREIKSDYYIYASDDLMFQPDSIEMAMRAMWNNFPGGFGLISLGKKNRCAFGLIGAAFADHFPNRQVFCPDYFHYGGDSELYWAVQEMKAFAYSPKRDSQVKHSRLKDECWRMARKARTKDHTIYYQRKAKGFIWGVDFERLKEAT